MSPPEARQVAIGGEQVNRGCRASTCAYRLDEDELAGVRRVGLREHGGLSCLLEHC